MNHLHLAKKTLWKSQIMCKLAKNLLSFTGKEVITGNMIARVVQKYHVWLELMNRWRDITLWSTIDWLLWLPFHGWWQHAVVVDRWCGDHSTTGSLYVQCMAADGGQRSSNQEERETRGGIRERVERDSVLPQGSGCEAEKKKEKNEKKRKKKKGKKRKEKEKEKIREEIRLDTWHVLIETFQIKNLLFLLWPPRYFQNFQLLYFYH